MGRCESCRCYDCTCLTPEQARELREENKRLKDRIDNALMHLGMLYRGEWATNDERDSIIDATWDALRD